MKLFLFTVVLFFTLSGCTHYYYITPAKNVPLFKEKNDFKASAASGFGDEIITLDIQAAYAITNHWAVASTVMYAGGGNDTAGLNWGKGNYFDFAVGYYVPIDDNIVIEVFGGVGTSKQHHGYDYSFTSFSDLTFSSIFIQPSLGLTLRSFDVGLTMGLNRLHYSKVSYNSNDVGSSHLQVLYNIDNNRISYLLEPAITIRGGWKYIKGQVQLGYAYNLSNTPLPIDATKLSIGVQIAFANRFMNKKTER